MLLLVVLLLGVVCFLKRRKRTFVTRSSRATRPSAQLSDITDLEPEAVKAQPTYELKTSPPVISVMPKSMVPELKPQKPKNQRSGFSKQQFDEFG